MLFSLAPWAFTSLVMLFATDEQKDGSQLPAPFLKGIAVYTLAGDDQICIYREKGKVQVLSLPSGKVEKEFEIAEFEIEYMATSAEDQFLCAVGKEQDEGMCYVFDLKAKRVVARLPLRSGCTGVGGARNAKGFVIGLCDGTLMTLSADWKPRHEKLSVCEKNRGGISAVAMSSDAAFCAASVGGRLSTGAECAIMFDLTTGNQCWSHISRIASQSVVFTQSKTGHQLLFTQLGALHKLNVQKIDDRVKISSFKTSIDGELIIGMVGAPAKEGVFCFSTDMGMSIESDGQVSVIAKWGRAEAYSFRLSMSPAGRYVVFVTYVISEGRRLCIYDRDKKEYIMEPDPPRKLNP